MTLAQISRDCNEANKIVYEEFMLMEKIEILNGGLGWKIAVTDVNADRAAQIKNLKNRIANAIKAVMG